MKIQTLNMLRSAALCIAAGAMLVACGGSETQNQSATKLLASSTAGCQPTWSATTAYTTGNTVTYNSIIYKANWWTQGENPATNSGPAGSGKPWTYMFVCEIFNTSTTSTTSTKATTSTTATSSTVSSTTTTTKMINDQFCQPYVAGTTYTYGQLVTHVGKGFRCDVAGWCSLNATAYEPGVGWAWSSAWSPTDACANATTTTTSTTTSTLDNHGCTARNTHEQAWWSEHYQSCEYCPIGPGGFGVWRESELKCYGGTTSMPTTTTTTSSTTLTTVLPGSKHDLIGYWHNFTNPSGPTFRLKDVSNDWDVIMVSFGEDGGNGAVTFTLDPNAGTEAQFIADIAAKRAAGKKVVLSLGGQEGRMTLNTAENVTNFVNSLHGLITKYGFNGIDLDLESGAGVTLGSPIINNLITAVKQLKAKVGPGFYLSMAPEHPYVQGGYVAYSGIWGAYLPLIDGLRNELNVIHVQYYNNGGLYTPYSTGALNEGTVDALVAGSKMLIEGFKTAGGTGWEFKGLRPDQVAFGVPSGSHSANQGFVTAATVKNTLTCMTQLVGCGAIKPLVAYPSYRGVMTWSINWDKYDGYNFSVPAKSALNGLPH